RTMLTFQLPAAARVIFTVAEVSPVCRSAGTFAVRGHAGLNKVPFTGRIRGRNLPSGTYRITARTRGGGTVLRLTLVVVDSGMPSPTELENAKQSNVCGAHAALASSVLSGAAATGPEQPRPNTSKGNGSRKASG